MRRVKLDEGLYIGGEFEIIAGPCAVENSGQMEEIGEFLSKHGIKILRGGGAFKPRTDPKSFQGLGVEGFKILKKIKEKYNFKIVSEIMDPRDIEMAHNYIDIFQIGSRNMYNYSLLKEMGGKTNRPILLKRGMSATIEEWIKAAEYIEVAGNNNIILCERGIRSFDDYTRNLLDLMAVPIIKEKTNYPIIVDPSHGTGRRELILPAVKAAMALEADGGVMIEIHSNPEEALSDGGVQSLDFEEFRNLLTKIN